MLNITRASIVFMEQFYTQLLMGTSVLNSFKTAKMAVSVSLLEEVDGSGGESEKFKLMPFDQGY